MKKVLSIMLCLAMAISLISVSGITANVAANPVDITNGLIVHYDFNEASGTAVLDKVGTVDSHDPANGNWNSASVPANRVFKNGMPNTRVQGSLDGAVKFADYRNREHIYANADKLTNLQDMTITMWVNFDRLRAGQREFLFSIGTFQDTDISHKNSVIWMLTDDGNHIKYELKSDNGTEYSKAIEANRTFIEPDTYNLLTVTQSGNTVTLYVNGYLVQQVTDFTGKIADIFKKAQPDETMKMDIGGNSVWGGNDNLEESMRGTIDDFRIYNRALSDVEVGSLRDYFNEASTNKTKLHPILDSNAIAEINIQDDETPGNRAAVGSDGSFSPKYNDAMTWCYFMPDLFNTKYAGQTLYVKTYAKVKDAVNTSLAGAGGLFSNNSGLLGADGKTIDFNDYIAENGGKWNGDKYVSIVVPCSSWVNLTGEFGIRSFANFDKITIFRTIVISTDATPLPEHPANNVIDMIDDLLATNPQSAIDVKADILAIRAEINKLYFKDQTVGAISNLRAFEALERELNNVAGAGLNAEFFTPKGTSNEPIFDDAARDKMYTLVDGKGFAAFDWDSVIKVGEEIVPTVGIKGAGEISGSWSWKDTYRLSGGRGDNGAVTKMSGYIYSETGGKYTLSSKYYDNGIVVKVGGNTALEIWNQNDPADVAGTNVQGKDKGIWADNGDEKWRKTGTEFTLNAGEYVPFEAYYLEIGGGECLRLDVTVDGQTGYKTWSEAGLNFVVNKNIPDVTFTVKDTGGRGTLNDDGTRTHTADETMVWGMNASLPAGTYYMKFLAKGTGLDGKSGRISYVDGKQNNGSVHVFDKSLPDITTFTENTWKSIVIEFTIPADKDGQAIEYRINGPLSGAATFTVGPQVIISKDATPLTLPEDVDKTALNAAITTAEALYAAAVEGYAVGNYLQGSKATFLAAINAAKTVADSYFVTDAQVSAALTALNNAIANFTAAVRTVDKTELADLITELEALYNGLDVGTGPKQYSQEFKDYLKEVLDDAKAVLNDNAASEEDVEYAVYDISSEILWLPIGTNEFIDIFNQINDVAAKIEDYLENADESKYAAGALTRLEDAYLEAVQAYMDALFADELNIDLLKAVLEDLQKALDEFEASLITVDIDKTDLNAAISEAEALYKAAVEGTAKGQYKAGSKAKLKAAIDAAKAVAANEEATQEDIDAALDALLAAIDEFEDSRVNSDPKTGDMQSQIAIALVGLSSVGTVAILRKKRFAK